MALSIGLGCPQKNVGKRNLPLSPIACLTGVARSTRARVPLHGPSRIGARAWGQGPHRPIKSSPLPSPFPQPAQRPLGRKLLLGTLRAAAGTKQRARESKAQVQRNSPSPQHTLAHIHPLLASTTPQFAAANGTPSPPPSPPSHHAVTSHPPTAFWNSHHPRVAPRPVQQPAAAMASMPPATIYPQSHVGFDSITSQIERKLLKRGFQFNVICVGS